MGEKIKALQKHLQTLTGAKLLHSVKLDDDMDGAQKGDCDEHMDEERSLSQSGLVETIRLLASTMHELLGQVNEEVMDLQKQTKEQQDVITCLERRCSELDQSFAQAGDRLDSLPIQTAEK